MTGRPITRITIDCSSDIDHRTRVIPSHANLNEQATVFAVPQLLCMHTMPLCERNGSSRMDRALLDSSGQQPRRLPTEFQHKFRGKSQLGTASRISQFLPRTFSASRVTFIHSSFPPTNNQMESACLELFRPYF